MTLRTLLDRFDLLMDTPESVPQLRQTILQLAVQGRLTERDPDDTPADELLEEIRVEKKRLYESGEIRKPKSFKIRSPSDGELFEIPKSWEWVKFIDLYESVSTSGNELKTEEYQNTGIFPIIDQGKDKVAGYTDDGKKVISISKPIIMFGDHTREIKYVDFDFAVGSQGVKVFNVYPPTETRYLYWEMHALNVEDQGYRRHYKLLNPSCGV
jgi:type I restriction enzyme S subunit